MSANLKPCKDCGHDVSIRAKNCPNCGASKPAVPDPTFGQNLLGFLILAAIVSGIYFVIKNMDFEPLSENVPNTVGDAQKACIALEGTNLVTNCEVNTHETSIDVRIDTNGSEARQMCPSISEMMKEYTTSFSEVRELGIDWELKIFSPYSADQPIAVCSM